MGLLLLIILKDDLHLATAAAASYQGLHPHADFTGI
jgi:hypothetical protein